MYGFEEVVGHEDIIKHLQNAISLKKVSHSYIFDGEAGSGKKLLARLFAMTLQCEKAGIDPCLNCPSCKKVLSNNHPDIIFVQHEKPNSISVDEIRDQVVNDIAIKPYLGPYKIYIIHDAQKLTIQAQNALLKTMEEPPEYGILLLLTDNADGLLPTILSRCVRLQLRALSDDLVKQYLMEVLHIPDYQADVSASFARGNIGKARQIAGSEDFEYMTKMAMKLLKNIRSMELYDLVTMIKELSNEKQNISDYLELFVLWYRDVLLFKATREIDGLVFKNEYNYVKEDAQKRSYEGLEQIIEAIEKAKNRLRANVNFELTMELLFLTIKEN